MGRTQGCNSVGNTSLSSTAMDRGKHAWIELIRNRHPGQLRDPGRGSDRDLRANDRGTDRLHAVEDPDGTLRPGRRDRRARRLARLRRMLVLDWGRIRHLQWPRDLLA